MVMEHTHEHILSIEALIEALERAAQKRMPLELLQKRRELVLREMKNVGLDRRTTRFCNAHAAAMETWSPRGQGHAVKLLTGKTAVVETSGGMHGGGHGGHPAMLVPRNGGAQSLDERHCSTLKKSGAAVGEDSRDETSLCARKFTLEKWNGGAHSARNSAHSKGPTQ